MAEPMRRRAGVVLTVDFVDGLPGIHYVCREQGYAVVDGARTRILLILESVPLIGITDPAEVEAWIAAWARTYKPIGMTQRFVNSCARRGIALPLGVRVLTKGQEP